MIETLYTQSALHNLFEYLVLNYTQTRTGRNIQTTVILLCRKTAHLPHQNQCLVYLIIFYMSDYGILKIWFIYRLSSIFVC